MKRLALILVGCIAACPKPYVPIEPGPELDPTTRSCSEACATLAGLGCPEGKSAACTSVCVRAQFSRLTDLHPKCLADATTREAARACGSVTCED